jgi:hypothetical protein
MGACREVTQRYRLAAKNSVESKVTLRKLRLTRGDLSGSQPRFVAVELRPRARAQEKSAWSSRQRFATALP